MKKLNQVLDEVLQEAFSAAMATLKDEAASLMAGALRGALEARIRALLDEAPEATEAPAAPVRARAKAAAAPEAAAPKAPRRRKGKAAEAPKAAAPALDFGAIEAALAKYRGAFTPKGKPIEEVLARRMRKVLSHAESLGYGDIRGLAQRALALIDVNPMAAAMASWQALASRLGLPVPITQGQ